MIFSYNWLKDYVSKLPKPEKLAEILTMHSFEVESLKKKKNDWVLDIDILLNRGHDCLCHWGVAREITAITNESLRPLKRKKLKEEKGKIKKINLKIKCPKLVSRYSAIVIEGIKVDSSPEWLKERIESVGPRPINNIVDLTNYLMLETGQPFHVFDYDKIQGAEMVLRESEKEEKITTLDGKKHILDKGMLVIENKKKLIDLVGIMGGKASEADSKTKNIILQAGNFDRQTIYKTVKNLNHRTEASDIYSQDIDPNLTMSSLERAYFLLTKLSSGKIVQIIDIYPKKVLPRKISFNQDYLRNLLGAKITTGEIRKILTKLGFKIKGGGPLKLTAEVPTFRLDVFSTEDLVEEVGRIYGYQNIAASFPTVSLVPLKKNFDVFWEAKTKNIIKEFGFSEVYNYSFIGEEEINSFDYQKREVAELENPISSEQKYLRPSLIPNLLKNVKSNFRYFDQIKIFELGKIFLSGNLEKRMLSGVLADKKNSDNFYQLKGFVDLLLNKLGISDIWYDEYQEKPKESKIKIWHPEKRAEIKIGSEKIGFLGEISPEILNPLKIEGNTAFFDIDFEKLRKLCSEENQYQSISPHPAAVRDLAVLVPQKTKVVDVLNKINIIGGSLIKDIDIFDIYQGQEIPQGKKNFAFHIIYQAEDRTLTAREIEKIQNKIIKKLEEDPQWEVRKDY